MEAGDDLGLGFGQVEGRAVGLGHPRDEVDEEGDGLHQEEGQRALRLHNALKGHRACGHNHAEHRQAHRHFVAEKLRHCPKAAEQGVLAARTPPRRQDGDGGYRAQGDHVEHADVQVGGYQLLAEGHHRPHTQGRPHDDNRSDEVQELVGFFGHDVLFEEELEDIGNGLDKPIRSHPVGA